MGNVRKTGEKKTGLRAAAAIMALMLAVSPCLVYAKTAAAENVEKMIEALPSREEVGENNAESIRSAMESYMALTFAEQADISQELYERLREDYDQCLSSGFITDIQKEAEAVKKEEERTAREQAALTPSEEIEKGVTEYTFTITPDAPAKSITMRYIIDTDGDKAPDPPLKITVTTPTGEMIDVSVTDVEMKTEGHHIFYTWTDKFLQFDIAKAENGNWKIETSEPCVFNRMDYAGQRLDITPEKEKEETPQITPENEGGGGIILAVIGLIAIIGGVIAAVKFLGIELPSLPVPKSNKRGKANEDDEEEDDEPPYQPTDEEVDEIIRQDVRKRQQEAEEMDLSAEDDPEEEDDGDDNGFKVYREGETGLLDNANSPFRNGGGLVESEETEPYVGESNDSTGNEEDDDFFDDGIFE